MTNVTRLLPLTSALAISISFNCFAGESVEVGAAADAHSTATHSAHADSSETPQAHGGHSDAHGDGSHDGSGAAVNVLITVGDSSVSDEALAELQGGGHDPKRSGVTLQQIELALHGALSDVIHGTAYLVQGEEELELEEAYLEVTSHDSLRLRAGYFYSPFGVVNQRHPHSWQWIDQPLIATRLLGSDGARSWGARMDFALGHDWDTRLTLGAQRADAETLLSFRGRGHAHGEEEHHHEPGKTEPPGHDELVEHIEELYGELTVGNRPFIADGGVVYSARLSRAWDHDCDTRIQLGASSMFGPNASGRNANTLLLGTDLSVRWQPCENEWPFVLWESEYMRRSFDAASVLNAADPANVIDLPGETLVDSGWYTQLLYGFEPQFAAGLRYERASSGGETLGGTDHDPLRDNRTRLSPLLGWYAEELGARVRLQYNIDRADHLQGLGIGGDARSLWLGIDFTLGDHHHQDDPGLSAEGHDGHEDHSGHDHPGHEHAGPPAATEPEAADAHDADHDHEGHSH
jgi:hypothetical protein